MKWAALITWVLTAGGVVVWVIYLAADKDALKWIAFAILAVVAALGWTMFAVWARRRQARIGVTDFTAGVPPEQQFPVPLVAGNGVEDVPELVVVPVTDL